MASKFYILIDRLAAALQRTAIYYLDGFTIRRWNFETGEDILWSALPVESSVEKIEISSEYIHVHYLSTVTATSNGYTGSSLVLTSYRRKFDLLTDWEQYGVFGWNSWYGPGYDDIYATDCITFADGKTFYTARFRWHENPTVDHGCMNFITGDSGFKYYNFDPTRPIYYVSSGRNVVGSGYYHDYSGNYWSGSIESSWAYGMHAHDWRINFLGQTPWLYHQESGGLTASEATFVTGDGGQNHYTYEDHLLSGYTLGDFAPPVPFGTKSLVLLASNAASGANSVWWDGANWTDEFLGSSAGSLTTIRFRPGLAFCRTGKLYSLADGSLLHSLGTVVVPTGWQVYPKRR